MTPSDGSVDGTSEDSSEEDSSDQGESNEKEWKPILEDHPPADRIKRGFIKPRGFDNNLPHGVDNNKVTAVKNRHSSDVHPSVKYNKRPLEQYRKFQQKEQKEQKDKKKARHER